MKTTLIVKELNLEWYNLGVSCGMSSRKGLSDEPNYITNLGKQGVIKVPTEEERVSFFIGLMTGRRFILQNLNTIIVTQIQDSSSHASEGDYLTLSLSDISCDRGDIVEIPLYISNCSVDTRGVCGFQATITYDSSSLTFIECVKGDFDSDILIINNSGTLQLQGIESTATVKDRVLCWLRMQVAQNTTSSSLSLTLKGPSGSGTASDLFTLIDESLYYIQPLTLTSGKISLPDDPTVSTDGSNNSVSLPSIGSSDTYLGEDSTLTYNFTLDLSYVGSSSSTGGGGSGGGSGASLIVKVTIGDTVQYLEIPFTEGTNNYSGSLPLSLPSLSTGPVIIEVYLEPEDPNDIYYYFIAAGALWGIETEIPRDETGEIPIEEPSKTIGEIFTSFIDFVEYSSESGGGGVVVSDIEASDILDFIDVVDEIIHTPTISDMLDDYLGFTDSVEFERYSEGGEVVGITDIEGNDSLSIIDVVDDLLHTLVVSKENIDSFSFSDGIEIERE